MRLLTLLLLAAGLAVSPSCFWLGGGDFTSDPGNTRELSVAAPTGAVNGQNAAWQFDWLGGKPPYNIGLEVWRVEGQPDFQWYSTDAIQHAPHTAQIAVELPAVTEPTVLHFRAYVDGSADGSSGFKPVPDMADVSEDGTFTLLPGS